MTRLPVTVSFWVLLSGCATAPKLFIAEPVTPPGLFTDGIEGPACDDKGYVYAVNLERQGTIGRVAPNGRAEVYLTLPAGSVGNGIRFGPKGEMYVADYVGHNVFAIDPTNRSTTVFAHGDAMNQPNDLALGPNGTLYASDPNWDEGTGQLWRITPDGRVSLLGSGLGTTNGIEVGPDGDILYVAESEQRMIWKYTISSEGGLEKKRLFAQFDDHGLDGMRSDVDGNLYVTRHGKGTVVKLSPDGAVLQEVDVLGERPTNICIGGVDGTTAYVTEVEHRRLVRFRVDRPGLAWQRLRLR